MLCGWKPRRLSDVQTRSDALNHEQPNQVSGIHLLSMAANLANVWIHFSASMRPVTLATAQCGTMELRRYQQSRAWTLLFGANFESL